MRSTPLPFCNLRKTKSNPNNGQDFVRQRFTVQRLLCDMDDLYRQLLVAKPLALPALMAAPSLAVDTVRVIITCMFLNPQQG